ncbi:uncharacterized protein EV154DRAFT_500361 [Mucor mucedo]|uniref:uncharacterized protein n=1 Tax=Mucor mucedo TaxID=29922 RepID=UPI00221E5431|nr:uncharacterized protein EV154DRAFT_500361 [Mucor mucedo]KAI7893891.1 hypothetical protein EV154DRAFT_500361 [Mucor mucedo]
MPMIDCSPVEIIHIDQEPQIEHTPVSDDTNTIDAVLATSATKDDKDTTHVDNENDSVPKEEAPLTPSNLDTIDIQKDLEPCTLPNVEEINESVNAGVSSLADSEGEEIRSVPDITELRTETIVEKAQEAEEVDCDSVHSTEKNEKDIVFIEYSESLQEEEAKDLAEENTPFSGNSQPLLEQSSPTIMAEKTCDSPTLPPHVSEFEDLDVSEPNENENSSIKNMAEEESQISKDNSVESPPETVNSLEIASHQQEPNLTLNQDFSPTLPQSEPVVETSDIKAEEQESVVTPELLRDSVELETKTTPVVWASKRNKKKSDVIVKRRSGHSLIPRKQYTSVTEENSVAIMSKPVNLVTTPNHNEYNTSRRGSSGSFIPTFQQQNRLSLIISENNANYKNWGPSSFDSPPKSPNSPLSSTSTSSSGSSGATTKEKRSSMKISRSNAANILQHSKIPVVTVAALQTMNYTPKFSAANPDNSSKLPKRNSANL